MLEADRINQAVGAVRKYAMKLQVSELDDHIVELLRQLGFEKIESIKIVSQSFGLPISNAKYLVHTSGAWADRREVDDALHAEVERYFKSEQ